MLMTRRNLSPAEPTENFPSQDFTFGIPKDAVETKDLSYEDPNGDEKLGHNPNGTSQIFGGHFSQEHGNHVGGQTWQVESNVSYAASRPQHTEQSVFRSLRRLGGALLQSWHTTWGLSVSLLHLPQSSSLPTRGAEDFHRRHAEKLCVLLPIWKHSQKVREDLPLPFSKKSVLKQADSRVAGWDPYLLLEIHNSINCSVTVGREH